MNNVHKQVAGFLIFGKEPVAVKSQLIRCKVEFYQPSC